MSLEAAPSAMSLEGGHDRQDPTGPTVLARVGGQGVIVMTGQLSLP